MQLYYLKFQSACCPINANYIYKMEITYFSWPGHRFNMPISTGAGLGDARAEAVNTYKMKSNLP